MTRSRRKYRVAGIAAGLATTVIPLTFGAATSQAAKTVNEPDFDSGLVEMSLSSDVADAGIIRYTFHNNDTRQYRCYIALRNSAGKDIGSTGTERVDPGKSASGKTVNQLPPGDYTAEGMCWSADGTTDVKKAPHKFKIPVVIAGKIPKGISDKIGDKVGSKTGNDNENKPATPPTPNSTPQESVLDKMFGGDWGSVGS